MISKLCVVFLMVTSLLGNNNEGEEGYLSRTSQSTFWEQEDILMLSFMVLYDQWNWYCNVLSHQARRNCSGKIDRCSLQSLLQSSLTYLFNAEQDDAIITVMGFSFATFWDLLELFTPVYLGYTPHVSSSSKITHLPFRCQGRM